MFENCMKHSSSCLIYYLQYQHISQQGDDDDTKFINQGGFSPCASLELTVKEMNGHPARTKCDTCLFLVGGEFVNCPLQVFLRFLGFSFVTL